MTRAVAEVEAPYFVQHMLQDRLYLDVDVLSPKTPYGLTWNLKQGSPKKSGCSKNDGVDASCGVLKRGPQPTRPTLSRTVLLPRCRGSWLLVRRQTEIQTE